MGAPARQIWLALPARHSSWGCGSCPLGAGRGHGGVRGDGLSLHPRGAPAAPLPGFMQHPDSVAAAPGCHRGVGFVPLHRRKIFSVARVQEIRELSTRGSAISPSRHPLLSRCASCLRSAFCSDNEHLQHSVPCNCFYGCVTVPQNCPGT